jgi:hypothetical protein
VGPGAGSAGEVRVGGARQSEVADVVGRVIAVSCRAADP